MLVPWEKKALTNLDSIFESRDITLATKVHIVKVMIFSVVMFGCDSWTMKKAECRRVDSFKLWCWRRLLRVLWTARGSKTINPKGNQPWIFTGRTDAEVEAPILWPPDAKSWLIRKDPDTGKDWRREEKETIEDEMIGRHHRLNGRVWASSRRWWTGKPGVLQSMESQWVQHDWATEEHQQRSIMLRFRKTTVEEYRSPGIIRTSNFLCPWSLRGPLGAI